MALRKRFPFIQILLVSSAFLAAGCKKQDLWHKTVRPSALLGWEHIPSSPGVNSRGMLGDEIADQPQKGWTRALVIGDSFVDNARLIQSLSDSSTAKKLDHTEYLLGGMTGYGPDQYYLWYNLYGRFLKPNVVFVFWFVGNDLADIMRAKNNGGYQKPYFTLEDGRLTIHNYPLPSPEQRDTQEEFSPMIRHEWLDFVGGGKSLADKQTLAKGSHGSLFSKLYQVHFFLYGHVWLYRYLKDSLMNHWSSLSPTKQQEQLVSGDLWYLRNRAYAFLTEGQDLETAWTLNEAILKELKKAIQGDGGKMVLCLVPHLWQIDPESGSRFLGAAEKSGYHVKLDAPHQRLLALSRRLDVPFLDFTDALRHANQRGFTYDSKYSASHWSDIGLETVSGTVVDYLKANRPH